MTCRQGCCRPSASAPPATCLPAKRRLTLPTDQASSSPYSAKDRSMSALATTPRPKTSGRRLSSVLLVDRIEPCLGFWVDRLGFEVRLQIQGDDHLEFVILGHDDAEVMYRTRDSLHLETPGLVDGEQHLPWVVMYLEVDDLDD